MAPVEDLGDLVDALGARGGVAGGGAQVDVPQARGDLVDRDAGLKAAGGPVGAEGVWVREPVRDARGETVPAHDPMHGDSGQGEGLLMGVAAEPYEQRLLVEQRDAARERMDCRPRLECLLGRFGDRNFALAPALAADEHAEVPGV